MTAGRFANGGILPHGPTIAVNDLDDCDYALPSAGDNGLPLGPLPAVWSCRACCRGDCDACTDEGCACDHGDGG